MMTKKTPKNPKNIFCNSCHFLSSNKKDYNILFSTDKYSIVTDSDNKNPKKPNFYKKNLIY